jgi:acetylglutamate kinase
VSAPLTIKIGGIAGAHAASIEVVARDAPRDTVVVHGGGNEVASWSERLGIEPRSHEGLRVTDPETLEVVVAVLGGLVNTRLVAAFLAAGRPAIGLTGVDGKLLRVQRRDAALGEVGEVVGMDPRAILAVQSNGHLPVVAPIARDDDGAILNVNADEVAGLLAAARGGRLLLCTDVAGVLDEERVVERLDMAGVRRMLDDGTASAGMRPKLRAALVAARDGCSVRIIDGRDAATVAEAIAGGTVGTEVTAE